MATQNPEGNSRLQQGSGKRIRMKKLSLLAVFASAVMVAVPAYALGGCTNSPENPTLVLAGLAGGVYGVRSLRAYLSARKGR